jgi:hypothetical protein
MKNNNLLHKCLCRQTWNRSHREILIGKEREPLCDVAKLNRISWLPKKLLNISKCGGARDGTGGGAGGGLAVGVGDDTCKAWVAQLVFYKNNKLNFFNLLKELNKLVMYMKKQDLLGQVSRLRKWE